MTAEKMNVAECKNSRKYCHKIIGIGIDNTFQKQYWYLYWRYFLPKHCYWYCQQFSRVLLTFVHYCNLAQIKLTYARKWQLTIREKCIPQTFRSDWQNIVFQVNKTTDSQRNPSQSQNPALAVQTFQYRTRTFREHRPPPRRICSGYGVRIPDLESGSG